MFLLRALYAVQLPLAVLLPVWILVSRGILADGVGWDFVIYLILCPVLFIALTAISGLIFARRSTRVRKAVSWVDAAALAAVWASVFAYGLFALPVLAVAVVLTVLVAFWLVLTRLISETRKSVASYLEPRPRQVPDVIVVPRPPLSH